MSKREMTVKYLREMVKKSFSNVDIDEKGKMCVLPFQSLVDAIELYEDRIAWQEVEVQQLKEDYESIVEENSLLKADHKLMSDKLIALEVETNNQQAEIKRLTEENIEERDCKNHHEGHKTGVAGMQEQVEALNKALNEKNAELEEYVRKETVEKFASLADEKSVYFDMGNGYIYKAVHIEDIYEICKEINEGNYEQNERF